MKFKSIILVVFFGLYANISYSQPFMDWIKTTPSVQNDWDRIMDCGFDSIGNIYFCGFDSESSFQLDSFILNSVDNYILGKIDTTGNIAWINL